MKGLLFALSIGCASVNASAEPARTPQSIYASIQDVVLKDPTISEVEVCIEQGACETYFPERPRDKAHAAADPSVATTVGDIIGSASKAVGVGGSIAVSYHRKPDGEVKVDVKATFGTGTGAAAAAGGPREPEANGEKAGL